jgi:diguanylate cyclase (GGDEF)-like protein
MDTALIIEAHGAQAVAFKIAARTQGLAPACIRDARAAMRQLREQPAPRLTILGTSTSETDLLSVLRGLRSRAGALESPIIVCRSVSVPRERAWAERVELGISQLLAIPASIEAVQSAIAAALTSTRPLPAVPASETLAARARAPERVPPKLALEEVAREVAQAFSAELAFVLIEGRPKDCVHVGAMQLLNPSVLSEWPLVRHVISARSPLIAIDAGDALFDGDAIAERLEVQSFAAVPLVNSNGRSFGALGILDRTSLALTSNDLDSLVAFGRRLTGEFELLAAFDDVARTADRLASSLSQVQSILDHLDEGVLLLDRARVIVSANPAFALCFEPPAGGWLKTKFDDFVAAQAHRFRGAGAFEQSMRVHPEGVYAFSETVQLDRPRRRILRWSAKPIQMQGEAFQVHQIKDITLETDLLRQKEELALTDALTGLGNRRASEEALQRELARSARDENRLALVLVDVDWFKRVNDRAGHAIGDRVLAAIGDAIRSTARRSDLAFRWGGEEFLVLLPDNDLGGARTFGERLRARVEALRVEGWDRPVTVSVGAAEVHGGLGQDAFLEADRRLHQAKVAGRNRVR